MSGIAEVGATGVELKEHQCSIKKITVSTEWKAPGREMPEDVCATVYDNTSGEEGRTLYLISSPKGKKVTIKTEREEGECQRESHRKYQMAWVDFKKKEEKIETNVNNQSEDISISEGGGFGSGFSGGGFEGSSGSSRGSERISEVPYSSRTENKFNAEGLVLAAIKDVALSFPFPILPFNLIKTPMFLEQEIKNEDKFEVKCFEIGGELEELPKYWQVPFLSPLDENFVTNILHIKDIIGSEIGELYKYLKLPIPLDKNYETKFSHRSCKEGPIHYQIVSYPDISFKLEVSVGTDEPRKKRNGRSYFKSESKSWKYIKSEGFNRLNNEVLGEVGRTFNSELSWSNVTVEALTSYNGGDDEIGFKIDLDPKKELIRFKFKHDTIVREFGSQDIPNLIYKIKIIKIIKFIYDLGVLLDKICNLKFIKEIFNFKDYKPYKLEAKPPGVLISYERRYHTSSDLLRIGKCHDFSLSFEPLVSLSLTIDLLFVILTAISDGAYAEIYAAIKNFDKVLKKVLGNDYKEKYKGILPFDFNIYFDFVISGAINCEGRWIIDTTEEDALTTGLVAVVLKADLKAGAKVSVKTFFIITTGGELSGSATSGFKFQYGLEKGKNLVFLYETIFLGLKLKWCAKANAGLFKIKIFDEGREGEKDIIDMCNIKCLSGEYVIWEKSNDSYGRDFSGGGHGGGGGQSDGGGQFGGGGAGR